MQIKYKKGICAACGKEKLITQKSKKLCYYCQAKASAKRSIERKIKQGKFIDKSALLKFYESFYNKQPEKICFETGVPIPNFRIWNVHHVLEKHKYPEYTFNEDVCVLLTLEQHSLWHGLNDSDKQIKMPKTWKKYQQLMNNHVMKFTPTLNNTNDNQ